MIVIIDHDAVVQSAHLLPPLPQSATRLASLLARDEPDVLEIVKVIECDPTLTMKLLRLANSAIGSARHRIGTVREALTRLGTGTVVGFVIGKCVRPLVGKRIPGYNVSESEFWTHSLTAAFAAESIQARSAHWSGHLGFTAALLHDVGKLVLGQFLNAELSGWLERAGTEGKLSAFHSEKEILSLHHGEIGAIVAQHWGLPACIVKGIEYHHDPENGMDGICDVTYLANLVSHWLEANPRSIELAPQPMLHAPVGPVLDRLGLAEKCLVSVCEDVRRSLQAISGQLE
jgi:putative nucleotidyltransferase with HDIG domain